MPSSSSPITHYAVSAQQTITPQVSAMSNASTSSMSSVKSAGKKVGNFLKNILEPPVDREGMAYNNPIKRGIIPATNGGQYQVEKTRSA